MGPIYDAVKRFFDEDEWPYYEIEVRPKLIVNYRGTSGTWTCSAHAEEEKQIFIFYSYCPMKASENKRPVLGDFITRANYGLPIGNFEMDYNDGEIRYKTSIDVEGTEINSALIKRVVYDNVAVMNKYLPGVMSVIYGGASPTEAIAEVEN